jgi:hypothetical protein
MKISAVAGKSRLWKKENSGKDDYKRIHNKEMKWG